MGRDNLFSHNTQCNFVCLPPVLYPVCVNEWVLPTSRHMGLRVKEREKDKVIDNHANKDRHSVLLHNHLYCVSSHPPPHFSLCYYFILFNLKPSSLSIIPPSFPSSLSNCIIYSTSLHCCHYGSVSAYTFVLLLATGEER